LIKVIKMSEKNPVIEDLKVFLKETGVSPELFSFFIKSSNISVRNWLFY